MKKVLITGVSGFAGSHLAELLLAQNYEVSGTYLTEESLNFLPSKDKIDLHQLDLLDEDKVKDVIAKTRPDFIYHLAAATSPRESFNKPKETLINNISGQVNLLEAIKEQELLDTRTLVVSSAEVYGLVKKEDLPIDEETPFNPTNPYSVSKLAQDFLGVQYFNSSKLKVLRVRPFNHIGPRQSPSFVVAAFCKRIVDIENGKEAVMKVGSLTSKRDFTDVRDMVKAYQLALEQGELGEVYNLGSGKSFEIGEILDKLIGMAKVEVKVEEDESLIMQTDNPEMVCDYSKFNGLTNWKPEIPLDKTLSDTLDYWRRGV